MYLSAANTLSLSSNTTQRLTIESGGTVGIGTATPSSYVSTANNLIVVGATTAGISIGCGANNVSTLNFVNSGSAARDGFINYATVVDTLSIGTSDTTRIAITSGGAVTVQAPSAGNVALTANGVAGTDAFSVVGGTSGNFRVTERGLPYGTSLHNNAGAVTGTTNQYIASGTYTPTLTNVTNVAASTSAKAQWMRVGNVVTVSGQVQIDATAATAYTQLGISLPIASNLTLATDLSGTAACQSGPAIQLVGSVKGDLTNDRAALEYYVGADAGNLPYSYIFMYEIL